MRFAFKYLSCCPTTNLLKFIYTPNRYPAKAREQGIEGTVVVGFVVEKDGSISNVEMMRDIGGGCGNVLFDPIDAMRIAGIKWIPGMLDGKPVRVQCNRIMKFSLD